LNFTRRAELRAFLEGASVAKFVHERTKAPSLESEAWGFVVPGDAA